VSRWGSWVSVVALGGSLAGCGGSKPPVAALDAVEKMRVSPAAREGAALAPQAFALAERERLLARAAQNDGDELGASLHADRALATYQHALVLARLARAEGESTKADTARGAAEAEARRLTTSREELDREGRELDKKLTVLQESLVPATSRPADAQRETARLTAARSLATQARLLCGAARLLSPSLDGLADAEKEAKELDGKLATATSVGAASSKAPAIDTAAHARVACLTVLTKARRSPDRASAGQADALLTELSAAGSWSPYRDERGVVVTLRDVFKGTSLAADAEGKLKELGRVLGAHPAYAAQVVIHSATAPSNDELAAEKQRAELAAKAIASSAGSAKVEAEVAGNRAPVVDPSDVKLRAKNARLDVVFVTPKD